MLEIVQFLLEMPMTQANCLKPPLVFMWLLFTMVSFLSYSSLSVASSCARLGYRLWDTEHAPSDCFDLED